jgi:hypothetical protein
MLVHVPPPLVFEQWYRYTKHFYLHGQERPRWDSDEWIEVEW